MHSIQCARNLLVVFIGFMGSITCVQAQEMTTPEQMTKQLLQVYGRRFDSNAYIPAMALLGRLRVAEHSGDAAELEQVLTLVEPYLTGERKAATKSQPELAGHLLFAHLARQTTGERQERLKALVTGAANTLFADDSLTALKGPQMGEMSDAVFMCGPLLCEAGSLSGDARYYDAALEYLRAMRDIGLRDDGIYRHSHLCDAAWGRGNGFPAIGVARCLERMPTDFPGRDALRQALESHLRALLVYQDQEAGCWYQVVDRPDSFKELTATCMIGWALQRGLQERWIAGEEFERGADLAWQYVTSAVAADGTLKGVCESTGKQATVEDYLRRRSIQGRDDRGGAMALLFAASRL